MALKLVVFSCLLACAYGSVAPAVFAAAPLVTGVDDASSTYRYGYEVSDVNTGDFKNQNEEGNGEFVRGQYSFLEADGTRRVVDYIADPINGFNAAVRNELVGAPLAGAEPVVAARIAAAPVPALAPARYAVAPAAAPVYANYAAVAPTRYTAAPVAAVAPTRYTAAPVAAVGPYAARYAVAPAAAPVAAVAPARYAGAPTFAYAAPYTTAYASPYAAAYTAPYSTAAVTQYSATGPLAAYTQYSATGPLAAYAQYPSAYAAPVLAPYRASVAAAPAKLVDATPVAAAGYRYP